MNATRADMCSPNVISGRAKLWTQIANGVNTPMSAAR